MAVNFQCLDPDSNCGPLYVEVFVMSERRSKRCLRPLLAVVLLPMLLLAGCATERPLMPTPAIYEDPGGQPLFTDLPPTQKQSPIDLLYITDRARETDAESDLPYGAERSREIAFGTARVDVGPSLDWKALRRQSRLAERTTPVNLSLGDVAEVGRFPPTPYPISSVGDGIVFDIDVLAEHQRAKAQFLNMLETAVAKAPRKEVVVYVHGFNETFETAMYSLAELCHFLGREFACVLFSWPAGSGGGLLTSYGRDRESSEFGMFHLKKMLRMISQSTNMDEAHLLAHSRGTDVLLGAIRELGLESYSAGKPIMERLGHVVLLAPDIDQDVAGQRIAPIGSDPDITKGDDASPFSLPPNMRMTVYVSPEDRALKASALLFRSKRLGRFTAEGIDEARHRFWDRIGIVKVIQAPPGRTDAFGHGYFTTNTAVSSDLMWLIRYDVPAGDPRRPLEPVAPPVVWGIPGS